jgi:protein-disulfide isomerase
MFLRTMFGAVALALAAPLAHCAPVEAADEWGRTPLIVALQAKDAAAVGRLLDAGASVSTTDAWGRTPLLVAAQMRDTGAMRRLIELKADLDAANRNDITPLIATAQTGNIEGARLLLDAGADPERRDNLGLTALAWAERREQEPLAQLLRERGARATPAATAIARADTSTAAALVPRHDPSRAIRGNPAAPITIYEYTDFQCPYCAHGAKVMDEVMARYEGQVRLVVKQLPLPAIHPMAVRSARYFEALSLQDGALAWKFYDRVFREQSGLARGEAFLREVAAQAGADAARLERDLAGAEVQGRIDADLGEARAFRFDGVPAFVVAGRVLKGAQPSESFFAVVDAALLR